MQSVKERGRILTPIALRQGSNDGSLAQAVQLRCRELHPVEPTGLAAHQAFDFQSLRLFPTNAPL